jgi:hypothetical protein
MEWWPTTGPAPDTNEALTGGREEVAVLYVQSAMAACACLLHALGRVDGQHETKIECEGTLVDRTAKSKVKCSTHTPLF